MGNRYENLSWTSFGVGLVFLMGIVRAQAAGPVIILVGPPGAGKNTQAQILQKDRRMALVSSDELIEKNRNAFEKFRQPAIHGVEPHQDPAMNKLVEEKLASLDLTNGVIFDGYPASKEQGDYLVNLREKFNLPKPAIIRLKVPDEVVLKRLKQENPQDVEQRLKDYHREFDFAQLYFPQADIHEVDGTKSAEAVAKEIQKVLSR
jgi:adenylate kinase